MHCNNHWREYNVYTPVNINVFSVIMLLFFPWNNDKIRCYILTCRSLFVPYFKHLLGGCVHHLCDDGDVKVSAVNQKKKARILDDSNIKETGSVSIKRWHLRALVLSSLHKCFLYDTGTLKFLDSSNFQASESFKYNELACFMCIQ